MPHPTLSQINTFLKAYYAAELGVAAVSELTLSRVGPFAVLLAPAINFQRVNAAVQALGWAALIAYLDNLEKQELPQA